VAWIDLHNGLVLPLAHELGQQCLSCACLTHQQQVTHGNLENAVDAHNMFYCFVLEDHIDVTLEFHVLLERIHLLLELPS